jgi:hypothetical protein
MKILDLQSSQKIMSWLEERSIQSTLERKILIQSCGQ